MSSSRRMSKQREDGEFFLECKAAFLSIYDDIDDRIESKKSLNTLLQTTGRNPTRTALSKYWPHDTVEMSFNDFVDICKKEPVTSADDLMKAFRKIDINGDGYISLDELYKIMNAQGENMSRDEVRKMIDEVDENKDGKLDYSEFTNMVMKTSEESKQFSVKVMERKEKKKRRIERARNSGSTQEKPKEKSPEPSPKKETHNSARTVGEELDYDDDCDIVSTGRPTPRIDLNSARKDSAKADVKPTPREEIKSKSARKEDKDEVPRPSPRVTLKRDSKGKSSSSSKFPDPKSLRDWTKFSSKGCFFYEEDEIVSHVFSLRLRDDSTVFLSAKPIQEPQCLSLSSAEPVDTALYIFDKDGRLVTFTELRDVEGKFGVKLELRAGEYQVLPYTTGCRFKQRQADQQQHVKEAKLVKKGKDDNIVITSAFRRALEDIFDLCDLDNNGTMSYDEFNWFNLRTSGEELEEEEWKVVEERTTLENGEITKQGFIELNEMEAEDVKGDTEDLWITLTSMGMNKALIMDEACPYRVEIYIEETGNKKSSFKVTGIESLDKKEFVDEICRYVLEKGEPSKIRSMKDLYSCTYKNDYWANVVIDNRSRSTMSLEVDCSKSRNVESNRSGLDYTFEVDPQSTAIAHYLMPRSETNDWNVHSDETIHK